MDKYIKKYVDALKEAKNNDEWEIIINKIYLDGFEDGIDDKIYLDGFEDGIDEGSE